MVLQSCGAGHVGHVMLRNAIVHVSESMHQGKPLRIAWVRRARAAPQTAEWSAMAKCRSITEGAGKRALMMPTASFDSKQVTGL